MKNSVKLFLSVAISTGFISIVYAISWIEPIHAQSSGKIATPAVTPSVTKSIIKGIEKNIAAENKNTKSKNEEKTNQPKQVFTSPNKNK